MKESMTLEEAILIGKTNPTENLYWDEETEALIIKGAFCSIPKEIQDEIK